MSVEEESESDDELIIVYDDEEPNNNFETTVDTKIEMSTSTIKEEKEEYVEEVKVAYQCTEVKI